MDNIRIPLSVKSQQALANPVAGRVRSIFLRRLQSQITDNAMLLSASDVEEMLTILSVRCWYQHY